MGGGVETTVMNHYRHIDRSQVQFDFIVQTDSTVVPKDEIESLDGRVSYIPPYSNPVKYVNDCRQLFQQTHPRIVHSHMNAVSVFTLMAAKQTGVPVRIAHSHRGLRWESWTESILCYQAQIPAILHGAPVIQVAL